MNARWLGLGCRIGVLPWVLLETLAGEPRMLTFTRFETFERAPGSRAGEWILTSPPLSPGLDWDELVVSWNAASPVNLKVEARPLPPADSRFYSFGHWAAVPGPETPRSSLNEQKDSVATMQTDTLVLNQPAESLQIRITFSGPAEGLKRLSLTFTGPTTAAALTQRYPEAWGRDLGVPIRSQADYPEGVDKWCSPTSTAMLLAFWGEQLPREDLFTAVPEVAAGVFDPGWGGTGNWPFNMAWAGRYPGIHSAVGRLAGLADLERWIAAGAPTAASVSYALLKGKAAPAAGDGHLVVVRGFTPEGDVIVNDPGVRRERVRRVFPRADFERAWNHSKRTVYLVWPEGHRLPTGPAFPQ